MTKTVLIAGASRGIGLEMAVQYAAEGWHVIAGCRAPDVARKWLPSGVDVRPLDVTCEDSVQMLADYVAGMPIDLVIANAGLYGPHSGGFAAPDTEDFDAVMRTNVLGPTRIIAALAPRVVEAQGMIVAVSSRMGSISETSDSHALLYRCSKAALNMVVKSASNQFGPQGATVVCVHPGWVRTDMGGPAATLDVTTAVEQLRSVIGGLQRKHNGRFLDYSGREIDW